METQTHTAIPNQPTSTSDGFVSQWEYRNPHVQKDEDAIKLFVGQVPKTLPIRELKQYFDSYGDVCELTIITDKVSHEHKGCAFLIFKSKAEADNASVILHNREILPTGTSPMQLKYAIAEAEKLTIKLFVGSLPRDITDQQLQQLFEPFGDIEEASVLKENGVSKGCGFVKFKQKQAATNAMNSMNGYNFNGSSLVVKVADTEKQKIQKKTVKIPTPIIPNPFLNPAAAAYMYPALAAAASGLSSLTGNPSNPNVSNPYYHFYSNAVPQAVAPSIPMPAPVAAAQVPYADYMKILSKTGQFIEGPPGCNIFVYHLPGYITDFDLYNMFAPFGNLVSAHVYVDRETGGSKGFGFVSYDNPQSTKVAIDAMNGYQLANKRLKVELKKKRGMPY